MHMRIVFGLVCIKKKSKLEIKYTEMSKQRESLLECHLCMKTIENPQRSKINCINPKCILTSHLTCLANQCLTPGQYVPIEGNCPICDTSFLWGDLIRKKNGCNDLEEYVIDNCNDSLFGSDELILELSDTDELDKS